MWQALPYRLECNKENMEIDSTAMKLDFLWGKKEKDKVDNCTSWQSLLSK